MKALSKPLSSPSRAEKFPPPLMRFLRTNMGSRSRGRSRSSPIFYLRSKKRPSGGVIETTQEPSSPKVTCIGQVRVRRKKNGGAAANRRRRWLNKTLFCGKSSCRFPKKPFGRVFCKWGLIFRSGCCREVGVTEEGNFRVHCDEKRGGNERYAVPGDNNNKNNRNSISSNDSESDFYRNSIGDGFQESKREFLECSSSSPPKNALLLTRCRSAPYRCSSLGGRFWAEEKGGIINEEKKTEELEKPRCENENVVVDDEPSPRPSEENSKKLEKKIEDLKANNKGIAVHPLLLTRCKSEPARKGERLTVDVSNTEENASFLLQTRERESRSTVRQGVHWRYSGVRGSTVLSWENDTD